MDNQREFTIMVDLQGNYHPPVFDLSGTVPFELYLHIRRSNVYDTDPRHLVFLRAGSVFDLPAALGKSLVELMDETSGEAVRIADQFQEDSNYHPKQAVPLYAALYLSALVQLGHEYCLRLHDKDLGVQWWAWGGPPEPTDLPPTEPQRLISSSPYNSRKFTVVSEITKPAELSISLSLGEEAENQKRESGVDSEEPSPAIQIIITITNKNDQSITLKTSGLQRHLHTPGEIPNPRARVTAQHPDVQNFSVIDCHTQEELMSDALLFVSPVAGGSGRGWPRKQFLTLAPQEQVIRTVTLPGRPLATGKEYHVRLRPTGCWWAYGMLDDLFGINNTVLKNWQVEPMLRMPLASKDMVVFRF